MTEAIPPTTAVTLGMFDGVHCAHQALIHRTVALAAEHDLPAAAFTLDRHADEVLRPERARPYITTLPEKVALIRSLGISLVVVARVTPTFLAVPAREFISRYLHDQMHARVVVVGSNFRFGQGRQGDIELLEAMQDQYGYQLEVLEPYLMGGEPVSSTRIRRALAAGEVENARELLGRPYRMRGEVVRGMQIGRTMGFPTANVAYPPQKILPALGVYLCRAQVGEACYAAAVNVGRRPTFEGTHITVEAHLLDFSGDLYGQKISLDFLERLRPERQFENIEALRAQIARDVEGARAAYARPDGPFA